MFTLLTLISLVAPSYAEVHTTGAAGCQKSGTSGTLSFSSTSPGAIYNSHTSQSLTVVCPLSKRLDPNGFNTDNEVWVSDGHSSSNVSCTIYEIELVAGGPVSWVDSVTVSSSGSGTTLQRLQWDGTGFTADHDFTYSMRCTLPPYGSSYSYLVSYEVEDLD